MSRHWWTFINGILVSDLKSFAKFGKRIYWIDFFFICKIGHTVSKTDVFNGCNITSNSKWTSKVQLFFLQFELSLLLYLPPTLSILTSCTFTQKWGRFHLKLLYTKMTESLMILTWYAVHNQLESIEGTFFQFYNFY